jgi:hypothetical protein
VIQFTLIDPRMTTAMLGFLPSFLDPDDPRSAAQQIDANYAFGGWEPLPGCIAVPDPLFAWTYPGDPVFLPLAAAKLRHEVIAVYKGDFVGIWQRDGSFEISRVD